MLAQAVDSLSMLRAFKPGACPAKGVRIRNVAFYAVTLQNVETDPRSDYVGLAEGEHVRILPGEQARRCRDAHLNHCNEVQEYTGPVFMVRCGSFGHGLRQAELYPTKEKAEEAAEEHRAGSGRHVAACREEAAKLRARANPEAFRAEAQRTGIGIALVNDPAAVAEQVAFRLKWAQDTDAAADREEANPSFVATIEEVTGRPEYAAQFVRG